MYRDKVIVLGTMFVRRPTATTALGTFLSRLFIRLEHGQTFTMVAISPGHCLSFIHTSQRALPFSLEPRYPLSFANAG